MARSKKRLGKINVKNPTVLIMPLESIILSHYLLLNIKNCIIIIIIIIIV